MRRFFHSLVFAISFPCWGASVSPNYLIATLDLKTNSPEFRLCRGNECGGQKWFVSFLPFDQLLFACGQQIDLQKTKINGTFTHPNLVGPSYPLFASESAVQQLDEANSKRPLLSTWDSVKCKGGWINLVENEGNYFFESADLANCKTEWDD